MKVLVTGASGQLARALLESVPPAVTVIATGRAELDVSDAAAVHAFVRRERPALIVNTAAYTAVDRAESEPQAAERVNGLAVQALAAAARDHGARLIQISTDYVFDGRGCSPYRADAATAPINVYGLTKRQGEEAVLATLEHHGVVLRTSWLYGPWGSNFLLTMLRLMQSQPAVRVVSDQIGTPTAVESVAQAVWLLAAKTHVHGIQHCTDAGVASWYDFAVAIAEEAHALGLLKQIPAIHPVSTAEFPRPARRPSFSVLDSTALREALAVKAVHWRSRLRGVLGSLALRSGG